ncbi:MAG: hypothetical protein IJ106_16225 [Parasporobacterium sp.]|nr:hypothetical protein [Parasporobacterium sp.]MBQ9032973.1 hypothetical protein [Parasporobacterium sp.]
MKKIISLLMALALSASIVSFAGAQEPVQEPQSSVGILPEIAGENGTTYTNLFEVILSEEYAQVWYDYIAAIVGEENAAATAAGLQGSISSELYGEEAIEAFADGGMAFDCWYINDVQSFTFRDDTITTTKTDGSSETHTYEYLGQYNIGEGESMNYMGQEIDVAFPCDVYQSTDEAGEFNYFFLRDDTMAETYHIEFRYGRDLEELQGYFTGPYAYWLSAGIDAEADAQTIQNVIGLFCLENMDYSAHAPEALAQLSDLGFIGTWVADLSEMGEEFEGVELFFTLDENGHGDTFMNGTQTADFEAYAFDNGEKGDGAGIYVAYSNYEFEAEAADYTLLENEAGEMVLTFYSEDGVISYVKSDAAPEAAAAWWNQVDPDPAEEEIAISTVEELQAINDNLSADYILMADLDLEGIEWTPIGSFVPSGEEEEEQEIPDPDYAFTGNFNGNGHTIRNLSIDQPEGYALGLFGCIAESKIGYFTLENAEVTGTTMAADVVGYAYCSVVYDVTLENGSVNAFATELSEEGMYGGIVAAGMGSLITDCKATADIVIPDGTANAGIVGGGLELTSVAGCVATGSVTAGSNCYGLGGISGCGFGAEEFSDCVAENVTITAGDDCFWIGGITGYAGGYEDEMFGIPVTQFTNCVSRNVVIDAGANADGVDPIVGSGFYDEMVAEMMGAPFDQPTVYELTDCSVE